MFSRPCFDPSLQVNAELRHIAAVLIAEQVREDDMGFMNDLKSLRGVRNAMSTSTTTASTAGAAAAADTTASNHSLDLLYNWKQSFCHILPQSDYIWDRNGDRTCNYVLRYEHLEAEFNTLARRYHTDLSITNATIKHMFTHNFDVTDMSEDVRERFSRIYEADFCSLGYSRGNVSYVPAPLIANTT